MTSREHAARASELLTFIEARLAELREASPELELELVVSGAVVRLNADLRFSLDLSHAHAAAAIALAGVDSCGVPLEASALLGRGRGGFAERPAGGCHWGGDE